MILNGRLKEIVEGRSNLPPDKVEAYRKLCIQQGMVLPEGKDSAAQSWCLFYKEGYCAVAGDMVDAPVPVSRVDCANCMASRFPFSINKATLDAACRTLPDEISKNSLVTRYIDRIETDPPRLPCIHRGQTVDRVQCGCPGFPFGVRVKACDKFDICSITNAEWERAIEKYRPTQLKCCERCDQRNCT